METIKEFVARRKKELLLEAASLKRPPCLSIFQVGHDAGSDSYIRGKLKDAAELGFLALHRWFDAGIEEKELLKAISEDAADRSIDGIIVQLPLPPSLNGKSLTQAIPLDKDVDGFLSESPYFPCTPAGIVSYLEAQDFPFEGKNAVVIGRSDIVGKPMANLLLKKNMNVTVLHSRTKEVDMAFYLAHADLLVVAIGRPGFIDTRFSFKPNAYLIDVGISRGDDGHLHGDILPGREVAFQSPVPGGVGLLTRLSLMENVMKARKEHGE